MVRLYKRRLVALLRMSHSRYELISIALDRDYRGFFGETETLVALLRMSHSRYEQIFIALDAKFYGETQDETVSFSIRY